MKTFLKDDATANIRVIAGVNESIGAFRRNVDRLFDKHVQAVAGGGNPFVGMKAGWAADDDHFHRTVREKGFEIAVNGGVMRIAQVARLSRIGAIDGNNFGIWD